MFRGRDRRATVPGGAPQRFPGYDVLAEVPSWDAVTAGVVLARLGPPPPLRFFLPHEEAVAGALLDVLLAQHGEPRVPVLRTVDARLAEQVTDGWRHERMPPDGEAWRRSVCHLDEDAQVRFGRDFAQLSDDERRGVVQAVQDLAGAADEWHGLPASWLWSLWTRYACAAFYAHPWAWNEIGFGGPAYPRGYKHLGLDAREPWEVRDAHPDRDPVREPSPVPGAHPLAAQEPR
ncbi:MAG TPA: gluconate 2-dehydrogenase subunit 3 family protein [Mycobacteriales bacterium]|nr:gluconate 2-dehydrogenase subunit 3 family protein [Mycobacteriales bacterium]